MTVPDEITVDQYIEACRAFCEAVGLDPAYTLFPLVLNSHEIHFSLVVPGEDGFGKQLTYHTPGVGNAASVLTASGKIEVK